jgi:hypothetical protein
MPRGRTTSFTIRLTPAQRQTLRAWQRSTALPAGVARHARIILLRADGVTITDIAATVGMSRQHVYKWVQRFLREGLEGLHSKPRRDRRIEPRLPDVVDQNDVDMVFSDSIKFSGRMTSHGYYYGYSFSNLVKEQRPNIMAKRKSWCELLPPPAPHRLTTKSGGMWKIPITCSGSLS